MAMHIDYARELVERKEADSYIKGDSRAILEAVAGESELLNLVIAEGDDKHRDIATTMLEITRQRRSRRKITAKQVYAIVSFLLEKYGTARAALAAAFGVSEAEMFGEVTEASVEADAAEAPASVDHTAENAQSAARNAFIGAPTLKGSAKQVAWAETLRANMIDLLEADGYSNERIMDLISDPEALKAAFWIDQRHLLKRDEWNGGGAAQFVEYMNRPAI